MRMGKRRQREDAIGWRGGLAGGRARASLVGVALGAMAIAGYGLSSAASASTQATRYSTISSGSGIAVDRTYNGPDKNFLTLRAPKRKPGQSFTVGFLLPTAVQPNLDAGAATLLPGLEQARAQGIPVVGIASYFDGTQPPPKGYDVNIGPGYDYSAYEIAKAVAATSPRATFATMGLGIPVPVLTYLIDRQTYWATHFGLKYLGTIQATSDSTSGWVTAANAVFSKYPNMGVLLPYDDTAAEAAGVAAAQRGKHNSVVIATPNGGASIDKSAIESGNVRYAYATPWGRMGQQAAVAAYLLVTKSSTHIPKVINVASVVLKKSNVSEYDFGG